MQKEVSGDEDDSSSSECEDEQELREDNVEDEAATASGNTVSEVSLRKAPVGVSRLGHISRPI